MNMHCKNCQSELNPKNKYCPECGQKVHHALTLKVLFSNTVANYFSVDSRIFRSIFPLLSKPGYLAKKFTDGKQLRYLHPVQFYIFISVIFFFLLSFNLNKWQQAADSMFENYFKNMNNGELKTLNASGEISHRFSKQSLDSLIANNASQESLLLLIGINEKNGKMKRYSHSQLIEFYRKQGEGILGVFFGFISISLFVMIPLFAVLLKLLYWKNFSFSYHLVFSFSFFTFLLIMAIFCWLLNLIRPIQNWVYWIMGLISFTYLVFASNSFYEQRIKKVLFKTVVLLFSYSTIVLPFSIVILLFVSLLLL